MKRTKDDENNFNKQKKSYRFSPSKDKVRWTSEQVTKENQALSIPGSVWSHYGDGLGTILLQRKNEFSGLKGSPLYLQILWWCWKRWKNKTPFR